MQTSLKTYKFGFEGELFSDHYLEDRLQKTKKFKEEKSKARNVFGEIKELYESKKDNLSSYDESSLEEHYIKKILEKIDHIWDVQPPILSDKGLEYKPDYALFENKSRLDEANTLGEDESDRYFDLSIGILEAKEWGLNLDKGKSKDRNPAVQIKKYLRIAQINWGILTNGKKWRIYCKESGFSSNIYLEFDLEEIIVSNDLLSFRYFYTLLNQSAFLKKDGISFLDKIYDENYHFAREVEDDLEENVYDSLRNLAEGFLSYQKNNLSKEDIDEIHDNSLILLYRFLFLYYAEAKDLIEFEGTLERYSILKITEEILEEDNLSPQDDYYWARLKKIFDMVNKGSVEVLREEGIPPYNGGLFDPKKHKFLEKYKIGDKHLQTALDLLARRNEDEWVDYETLQIRHLGSIYEKLLEYKPNVADTDLMVEDGEYKEIKETEGEIIVKEGEVYLVTDKGERKATGSYYTPDYIVQYIVENTVGEVLEEKIKKAREKGESEAKAILELNVLDPAMGSGHFLVGATEYIAEELVEAINRDINNNIWEKGEKGQEWAKREVVSHCIYGVDVNPLAVELAKLSLWLTTLAKNKPLNFLDHRLKAGNSLIGDKIEKLPYYPEEDKGGNLYTPYIKVLTEQVSELTEIEEETVEDVKKKEELFQKIKDSKAYNRVKTLADARTALQIDVNIGSKDPKDTYMELVNEAYFGSKSKWKEKSGQAWVKKSKAKAEEKHFFHWELEFPEVFFEKGDFKENPGFDSVIGNPPYLQKESFEEDVKENYIKENYPENSSNINLATVFMTKSKDLTRKKAYHSFIVPKSLLFAKNWKNDRDYILPGLLRITDVSRAWDEVLLEQCIYIWKKTEGEMEEFYIDEYADDNITEGYLISKNICKYLEVIPSDFSSTHENILNKTKNYKDDLEKHANLPTGLPWQKKLKENGDIPAIGGNQIWRYKIIEPKGYFDEDVLNEKQNFFERVKTPHIVLQRLVAHVQKPTDHIIIAGAINDNSFVPVNTITCLFLKSESELSIEYLCALFNSTFISWYAYNFIFSKAIRSMDLYEYYAYKIPLRKIEFTTKSKKRKNIVDDLKSSYLQNLKETNWNEILNVISGCLKEESEKTKKSDVIHDFLGFLANKMREYNNNLQKYNLNLLDYIGNFSLERKLSELYTPVSNISETLLVETTSEFNYLKIGKLFIKDYDDKIELHITARYKPENPDEYETDKNGYLETDPIPAMKFHDLSEMEEALIKYFVPIAVEKELGNFRKKAMTTISILDRLEEIPLPKLNDVESGLKKYIEVRKKADELEEKVEKTDELIDRIVYKLYGLTEEEIEIIEETVD